MCGICGLIALTPGAEVSVDLLERMTSRLTHRGPDDSGSICDGRVGLSMRRLAIIDVDGGHQPMSNEDGTVHVIQNGEIYNYRALRRRLRSAGHRFRTESDTEVIVHLYEERDLAFAEELRGMFAVAIWDQARQRVILARDAFGIKPLLYASAGGMLAFSSEMKSLLEVPSIQRTVSHDALQSYLTFNWVPGPHTILDGVRKVPPGHTLLIEDGQSSLRSFAHRPDTRRPLDLSSTSDEVLSGQLRDRLRDSVRAHMISDVPVGVLLSGGVDSSLITAFAAEMAPGIKTFSIGFHDRAFNELDKARLVADRFGTDHYELIVEPDLTELLPELVETFDEPLGDSSLLPTYLVSRLARKHVTVALAGEGGDELFGGYWSYLADSLSRWTGPLVARASPALDRMPGGNTRWGDRARRFARGAGLPPLERHCAWQRVFSRDTIESLLLSKYSGGADPLDEHRRRYDAGQHLDWLTRLQDVDAGTYLPADLLMKSDLASMAHSLELRVPFLDPRVSEFAYALSPRHKVRGLRKKHLLRHAARALLPREITDAPKQGFSIPAASWLKGELKPFVTDVLSRDVLQRQGFFHPTAVEDVMEAHFNRQQNHGAGIWGLLMFTLWVDEYGGRAG